MNNVGPLMMNDLEGFLDDLAIKKCRNVLSRIKDRCTNARHKGFHRYGGRGIRCEITLEELIALWHRDGACDMERPSIDRIDPNGHYEYENCQFIESSENASKDSWYRQNGICEVCEEKNAMLDGVCRYCLEGQAVGTGLYAKSE